MYILKQFERDIFLSFSFNMRVFDKTGAGLDLIHTMEDHSE